MRRNARFAPIAVVVGLAITAPMTARVQAAESPSPVVIAHRGGAAEAPENTFGAFRQTITKYGTDVWLEMDTQLTADATLAVIHDDSLDRTTTCTGKVIDTSDAALADCNAGNPDGAFPNWGFEPVPTMESVLTEGAASGWRLMVELKNIPGQANFDPVGMEAAQELVRLVVATGFPAGDLQVQSFWPPSLEAFRMAAVEAGLEIETVFLTTSTLPGAPKGAGFLLTQNAVFATARDFTISAPDHQSADVSPTTVALAHSLGRRVVLWTVNDATAALRYADMGVDGLITNEPGSLLSAFASR